MDDKLSTTTTGSVSGVACESVPVDFETLFAEDFDDFSGEIFASVSEDDFDGISEDDFDEVPGGRATGRNSKVPLTIMEIGDPALGLNLP